MKTKFLLMLGFLLLIAAAAGFADTVVVEHHPYFDSYGLNPFGTLFYFLGDVVAFPFRLLGDLFEHIF